MINNYNLEYLSQEIKDRLGYANNASYKLEQPLNSLDNAKNSSANAVKCQGLVLILDIFHPFC